MRKEVTENMLVGIGIGIYLLCLFLCIYLTKRIIKVKYKNRKEVYGLLKDCKKSSRTKNLYNDLESQQYIRTYQVEVYECKYELIINNQKYEKEITLTSLPTKELKFYYNNGVSDALTENIIRIKIIKLKSWFYYFLPPLLWVIVMLIIF